MRRSFVFAAVMALLLTACSSSISGYAPGAATPVPALPSIKHVIVLIQENRSFNSLFMGFPGATTSTTGPCKQETVEGETFCAGGRVVKLRPITLENCSCQEGRDLCHNHRTFETEFDEGKMDGFAGIKSGTNCEGPPAGLYPYAYVVRRETKPYWDMAERFSLADRMFSTATTDSFVAHQQFIAGTTQVAANASIVDVPDAFPWGCDAPVGTTTDLIKTNGIVYSGAGPFPCFKQYRTMADVLDAAGVSWKYYVESFVADAPDSDFSGLVWNAYDAIWNVRRGADWSRNVTMPNTTIFGDIQRGSLPSVSWLIPKLKDSDHPAAASDTGPSWVTSVVDAVGKSRYWKDTAIVVVWDDWGGFYDNVPPPQTNYTSLGVRVPMILISPYATPGHVSHTRYDFGSVLRFIEENFGAASLGTSDAAANSIGDMFDFTQAPIRFVPIAAPYPKAYFLRPRPSVNAGDYIKKYGIPD